MRPLEFTGAVKRGEVAAATRAPHRIKSPGLPEVCVYWVGQPPDGYKFALAEQFRLNVEMADGARRSIVVPTGFVFNAASVPRAVWAIISPLDLGTVSVLIHDWLYGPKPHGFTRAQADKLFLKLMEMEGVTWWKRQVAYRAVRAFGGGKWDDGT